jgi:hypothetical protein
MKLPTATASAWFKTVAIKTPMITLDALYLVANAIAKSCVLSPISAKTTAPTEKRNAGSIELILNNLSSIFRKGK